MSKITTFLIVLITVTGCEMGYQQTQQEKHPIPSNSAPTSLLFDTTEFQPSISIDAYLNVLKEAEHSHSLIPCIEAFLAPNWNNLADEYNSKDLYPYFSPGQQLLFDLSALHSYMEREGVAQFLWTEESSQVERTIEALKVLHLPPLQEGLTECHIQWKVNEVAYTYWIRSRQFGEVSRRMGIDWFEVLYWEQEENIVQKFIAYAKENREDFISIKK